MSSAAAPSACPRLELQDIFRDHGSAYRTHHKLPEPHRKVMWAIENCRTSALGGHVDYCTSCGLVRLSYNSCGNRHCPKCQAAAQRRWVEERQRELLPVEYFHVVFTLPQRLVPLVRLNQKLLFGLLFSASAQTLLAFGRRHFKGTLGITSVLHTWGQTLVEHPHVHCLVTGGAFSEEHTRWRFAPKGFLFPVRALSRVFRGKFCEGLRRAYQQGALKLEGPLAQLQERAAFEQLVRGLYAQAWVVYAKRPFADAKAVVSYVGRYTHRVALSNHRLTGYDGQRVCFSWKDYRDEGVRKLMSLPVEEFMRRFLLHVLPPGFKRIRHYGLLANRGRSERLAQCRLLLEQAMAASVEADAEAAVQGDETWRQCPVCGHQMKIGLWHWPKGCGPPDAWQQREENAWVWQAA